MKKKLPSPNNSSLEVTMKTITHPLKTRTNTSLLTTKQKSQKSRLLNWLASSPPQPPSNLKSYPSTPFLCWLIKYHQSCLLPLTFQQAYWPELLELEYPEEQQSQQDQQVPLLDELWEENQVDYLLKLPTCLEEMPEEFCLEFHHLVLPWLWLGVGSELESSLGSSRAVLSHIKGEPQLSKSRLHLRVDLEST